MFPGLEQEVVDRSAYDRNFEKLRSAGIILPRIQELADPGSHLVSKSAEIADADPDGADHRNLFRVHWHNGTDRRSLVDVPEHIVLPSALTGVRAGIAVALGNRFPMISTHKVLAAYGCLIPRLLSGAFDAGRHRAVWPSTGNYCRGGVAIATLLGCRSIAVLPEGMSRERFDWLNQWLLDPDDIIRTPGTESNVKEIYDACHALARDPENLVLNQFSEYGNYIIHRSVTGPALQRVFEHGERRSQPAPPCLRRCIRFGRNAGGRGTSEAGLGHGIPVQSRLWSARPCCTTAMVNTTSRGSATSTFR